MKGFDWIFFAVMTPWLVLAIIVLVRDGVTRVKVAPTGAGRATPDQALRAGSQGEKRV